MMKKIFVQMITLIAVHSVLVFGASSNDFPGTDDYITITNFINPNSGAQGYFAWARADTWDPTEGVLFHQFDGTGTGRTIISRTSSGPGWNSAIGGTTFTDSTNPSLATWYFAGLRCASGGSGTCDIVINGNITASATRDPESATGDHIIGKHKSFTTAREWDGLIAYAHYFTKSPSLIEIIESQYKPCSTGSSLAACLPLWKGATGETDITGNANSGTWNNNVAASTDGPPVMFGEGLPL